MFTAGDRAAIAPIDVNFYLRTRPGVDLVNAKAAI